MNEQERTLWIDWLDRLVVVVSLVCLGVGLAMISTYAQADDDRIMREAPVPMVKYLDPRGNEVTVIDNDGTMRFDYGGTIAWSRYFVGESVPPKCRPVWVLTYVNGPGPRRPLFLQGCEPVHPKGAAE